MRICISHSGKQHSYKHALSVERAGMLAKFITSSYFKPDCFPDYLLAKHSRAFEFLQRRHQAGLPEGRVIRNWGFEVPELIARSMFGSGQLAEQLMFRRDAKFDEWVARNWVRDCELYWGFQGSCLKSLQAARSRGMTAVAEFATAHVTAAMRILGEEAEKHPEWAATISNLRFPDWYRQRLEQEPLAADWCVAASGFTRHTLQDAGVPEDRILLLPLGADLSLFRPGPRRTTSGKLKVLFVGGIGQRKGIKYLLDAIRRLRSSEISLKLVGPLPSDTRPLDAYHGLFEYGGRRSQSGVVREMQEADVLVLPSVFEGFGLVIVEAMATGLPVIASTHSCAPEVIKRGVHGFVHEPSDVDTIAGHLEFLATHRAQCLEMGKAAEVQAAKYSWDQHSERVKDLLQHIAMNA